MSTRPEGRRAKPFPETLELAPEAGVSFQPYLWPEYEAYHSDARFRAVLAKFSLPPPPTKVVKETTP